MPPKRTPTRTPPTASGGARPRRLPPPTPSEAAFERLLAEYERLASEPLVSHPPPASVEPQNPACTESPERDAFVTALFANRAKYLDQDRYATIGDAAQFPTKLVGVTFEGRQDIVAGLREGEPLTLQRQPENPYDPNAIAVAYGALQVGFLNRGMAKYLAPKLDEGVRYRAKVLSITGGGSRSTGVNIFVSRERAITAGPAAPTPREARREDVLAALIGDRELREAQRAVLERLESGANTLAVFGTGRGKSLCFQYPAAVNALERRAKTLVVYPLRALANDQFEALRRRLGDFGLRIFRANGSIDDEERANVFDALENGAWDIICSTPEFVQYHRERFGSAANRPSLLVVDESHHLFESKHRAAYVRIGETLDALGRPQVLALTATANQAAFAHLRATLGLDAWVIDPTVRENLHVVDARGVRDKVGYIENALHEPGKSIVYCNSRSETVKVAERLRARFGNEIAFYHAGVPTFERQTVEALFREGALRAIVATSAFGEGIDLPDVRNVFLYHLNFNFTEFNQQAGRAGRDGADASIHLLFGEGDRRINDYIIAKSAPSLAVLRELYRAIKALARDGIVRTELSELERVLAMDMVDTGTIRIATKIFEEAGLVEIGLDDDGRFLRFLNVTEKIDLTRNARFAEGEAEREGFETFCSLALGAKVDVLETIVDRPIYPENVPLLRP